MKTIDSRNLRFLAIQDLHAHLLSSIRQAFLDCVRLRLEVSDLDNSAAAVDKAISDTIKDFEDALHQAFLDCVMSQDGDSAEEAAD